ncbi:MAG: T9SS type A sorting domain-containing protein [Bacteroidales bacterium]
MKRVIYFFFLWSLFVCFDLSSQEWHQVYFPNKPNGTSAVFESYDKGYVFGGDFEAGGIPSQGMIIKTDINGEMLWYKTISRVNDFTSIWDINPTIDQGFILTGVTGEQTNWLNPFIMKLDACAQLQWCRIYNLPNTNPEWGQSIWQIPGGYISVFYAYGDDPLNERIWLFRLDNEGDLIWKQVYAQNDTAIHDENSVRMCVTDDYHFIINGYCWYPDPGSPSPQILRPFIIKTDSVGTLDWELPWAVVNGENFYGESYNSVTDTHGMIYSSGRHIIIGGANPGDKPCLIKTDPIGNEISYTDFFPNSSMGGTHTINWLSDSTLVLGYGYDGNVGAIKCDRNGNILTIKPILTGQQLFSDAVTTFDDKLLLVGGFWDGIWQSHAYKLNSNLDYDTIYNRPFVYDSLCPHSIPSDTIPLGCVLVGTEELTDQAERTEMLVYPNPVSEILHVILPDQLKTEVKAKHFNITTFRSRWDNVDLEVYNLFGERVFFRKIPFAEKEIGINVSGWQKGMYVVRLVYNNTTLGTTKVIKN